MIKEVHIKEGPCPKNQPPSSKSQPLINIEEKEEVNNEI
jgi:hypothetical protein